MGARTGRYGPNSAAVERLLDDLQHMGVPALVALAAAGLPDSSEPEASARAHLRARLGAVARQADRMDAIRRANGEVEAWASSVRHWNPAGVVGSTQSRTELEMRLGAVQSILDAAYGTMLEDVLAPGEADLLTAAWRDVVADPAGRVADESTID